ncbi:MAG: sensor histidine kinase [Bacteroidales bacterium]|nr:sensor histidine kinase [Bacteroidales bacterium]
MVSKLYYLADKMKLSSINREWLIIIAGWVMIYASTPLYMYYSMLAIDAEFDWMRVLSQWTYTTDFLVLFLLNHFILVPKLVGRKRVWQYIVCVLVIVLVFVSFMRMQSNREMRLERERRFGTAEMSERFKNMPPEVRSRMERTRFWLTPPDTARLVIALLMIGVDWGVMAWSNEQRMRQRLMMLEQQNLKHELQHLRYQINPHFFMNTLNNIHVLVDIDQERAKRAIVELSGLMRYALYEGNGSMVPLSHEMEFLNLYISLMRLRYGDNVDIVCKTPQSVSPDVQILPLLFPTFIENAFKHGVSCRGKSFIHVDIDVDATRQIHFSCVNSRHADSSSVQDGSHGIGLENVRKRLELQYADHHNLVIDDQNPDQFSVSLTLQA